MPRTRLRHYYLYNPICEYFIRRQEILAGRRATAIMPVSTSSARAVARDLRIPGEKLHVLPGPVDTRRFRPTPRRALSRPYLLCVSRLVRGKGFPVLFRATRSVVDHFPEIELRVVGDGKERRNLERLVRELGLKRNVTFTGELRGSRLIEQFQGATVFAFASQQEALGIVLLEALACGLPVVATDCGGAVDAVLHGRTGFLVPVGDWRSMAEYILLLLRNPELAGELSRAGRKRAIREFSLDVVTSRLDWIYQDAFGIAAALEHSTPLPPPSEPLAG